MADSKVLKHTYWVSWWQVKEPISNGKYYISLHFSGPESADSFVSSPPKRVDGRLIFYHISNEYGDVDEDLDKLVITFKGTGVDELQRGWRKRLDSLISPCGSRSPLNGKLTHLGCTFLPIM
ncbi:hypothetical protein AG4045_013841 [Apium graveolens]|uniref:Uncharacterized protein n=1 Tax=Apium graveolens TaxID=4045 RepID=A0A6L5BC45_APIGR|nr:hypothetical protein AG4045_013841 [Apium graveolens]